MVEVAAALIWRGDKFMICQRPPHKARGLKWEFVGGKTEPGESPQEALVRECKEEMDITVKPVSLFCELYHEYEDITVHLYLFNAEITEGEPRALEHNDIRFVTAKEAQNYDFCDADIEVLEKLSQI
ncbi:MAG: (deoxy)nucleoside triphosphate pyrophosphohydrolase [Oscillospiraceae bacterium]|nr:(deoxy)nucleoside triphosphate pyrophosphohydrolase [Oscillospiraceae bacterium]